VNGAVKATATGEQRAGQLPAGLLQGPSPPARMIAARGDEPRVDALMLFSPSLCKQGRCHRGPSDIDCILKKFQTIAGDALYFVSGKTRKREYFSLGERAFFSSPLANAKPGSKPAQTSYERSASSAVLAGLGAKTAGGKFCYDAERRTRNVLPSFSRVCTEMLASLSSR
jgi:hypothetical protein